MTQVTAAGFLRTRLDERLAQLQASYRAIYGDDISIDPDDLDGQLLGIFAERISDIDQLAEDIYNSLNPNLATGAALARVSTFNGIVKQAGSFSQATVSLVGNPGVTVPAGSLIKSSADNSTWATASAATFSLLGQATATVFATVKGTQPAAIGTLTVIGSPVFGWQSVTNAAVALMGQAEETDEQLRIRRRRSTGTPGQSILDAIYGAIVNLPGVRIAAVYENFTGTTDANGQAAHSIYAIVEGGDQTAIGDVLWLKKTAGAVSIGALNVVILDSQGRPHTVHFDRPAYSDIYITVNLTKGVGYPADGAARIKAALTAYGLTLAIGDDLQTSRLYSPVNSVPAHFVTSIFTGLTASPASAANIVTPFNGLARIDPSRIVVNET